MGLDGRAAIVTGGASGIGRATAILLAEQGAKVTVADIHADGANETAKQIGSSGGTATAIPTDVSSATSVGNLVRGAAETMGTLDIVINVAGIQLSAAIEQAEEDSWDRQFAVNVKSCFLLAKHAVPHMRAAGGGAIVNVASIAALKGIPGLTGYSASKGAVVAFTRTLAIELAPDNIRANSLCPGWVDTPFNDPVVAFMGGREKQDEMVAASVPLGRQALPPEMASALLFLVSADAGYMTGQALVIDGGITS